MPFANTKGTPFPTVLKASVSDISWGKIKFAGNDWIANDSATDILRGRKGCIWTSLFP